MASRKPNNENMQKRKTPNDVNANYFTLIPPLPLSHHVCVFFFLHPHSVYSVFLCRVVCMCVCVPLLSSFFLLAVCLFSASNSLSLFSSLLWTVPLQCLRSCTSLIPSRPHTYARVAHLRSSPFLSLPHRCFTRFIFFQAFFCVSVCVVCPSCCPARIRTTKWGGGAVFFFGPHAVVCPFFMTVVGNLYTGAYAYLGVVVVRC